MLLYAITISLSAFLLFEVQPIIAKIILPWFGGTSAVWTTCLNENRRTLRWRRSQRLRRSLPRAPFLHGPHTRLQME